MLLERLRSVGHRKPQLSAIIVSYPHVVYDLT